VISLSPRRRNTLLFYGLIAVVLIVDQLTKAWVVAYLPPYQPIDVVPWLEPLLSFTFVENTGVAFGLFPQLGGLFTVLSALVVVGILFFRQSLPDFELWVHTSLGLVTGGAIGNLIDRVARGYVVDFLDVNAWPLHTWPVFNVADSAIVVGVFVLLVDSFVNERDALAIADDGDEGGEPDARTSDARTIGAWETGVDAGGTDD
jgi:signal peptidase II